MVTIQNTGDREFSFNDGIIHNVFFDHMALRLSQSYT